MLICCLFLSPLNNISSSSVCPVASPPTRQNLVHSQCSINAYWREEGRKAGRKERGKASWPRVELLCDLQLQKWGHAVRDLTVPPATRLWVSCLWLQLPGAGSGPGCPARPAPRGSALLTPDSFLDCPAIWPILDPGLAPRPASTNQPAWASGGTRGRLCGHQEGVASPGLCQHRQKPRGLGTALGPVAQSGCGSGDSTSCGCCPALCSRRSLPWSPWGPSDVTPLHG